MKTKLFRKIKIVVFVFVFSLLGRGLGGGLLAQNGITISNYSARMGAGENPDTLKFDVYWEPLQNKLWSDTVWVFVDYNDAGTMTRLPLITCGATITGSSAPNVARVDTVAGNNNGVWVVGCARDSGSFSATVQLLADTVYLTGLCIYASNYPPRAEYTPTALLLHGTPPFMLTYSNGTTENTVLAEIPVNYATANTLIGITDRSGAPGKYNIAVADGPCSSQCGMAYVRLKDVDGRVINPNFALYRQASCVTYTARPTYYDCMTYCSTPRVCPNCTKPCPTGCTLTWTSYNYENGKVISKDYGCEKQSKCLDYAATPDC
jgi:hypothetical protein